jgi:EAL domain-containing protein (putative c-di-GMP-specific phosphodiesterase class I)/GGDEF domain-containing protein
MPLFRQLWLAVILITLTSFIGSFAVSIFGTRNYLEQRLQRNNVDAATMLARSISQLGKDPATIGAQTGALIETGQFQRITITAPDGKIIVEQVNEQKEPSVPAWFADFLPIRAEAGQAQISDNRMHFGIVKVVSHDWLAEQALWDETQALVIWYLIAGIVSALIGMLIMRLIKQPLAVMTDQAEAITERRFLTITEPGIPELKSIARATNDLVRRLHNRAIEETLHLDTLSRRTNHDPLTGLPNRGYFLDKFQAALERDQQAQDSAQTQTTDERPAKTGFLLLLRVGNLVEINRNLGRVETNALLGEIAAIMEGASSNPQRITGRLNGTDFALVLPGTTDISDVLNGFSTSLSAALSRIDGEAGRSWHIGVVQYKHADKAGDILASADTALALAQGKGANTWHIIEIPSSIAPQISGISDWRQIFSRAVAENRFRLALFPVMSANGKMLHEEAVARLQALPNAGWLAAGDFIPIAARLGTVASLDLAAVRGALDYLRSSEGELAINLSIETIHDWRSRNELAELLREQPGSSRGRLWIEVPEYGAFREIEPFRHFCEMFREMGCRIGIEHFGRRRAELQAIAAFGLDYIKVDSVFVRGINQNKENQKLLKALCHLARTLRVLVIALGVETDAERRALLRLGFDGITGPFIK